MKLLFDQNLSHKLAVHVCDPYPESEHVRNLGLNAAEDGAIREYAKADGFMIVSKDADFHQRSFVYGFPPKVIWVKLGNRSTADVEKVLRRGFVAVKNFHDDAEAAFLSLS
jgi:predicted nuclease of predicted toxin-antitoxin system